MLDKLGFTRQEQGIVLFLLCTLALGGIVTLYKRMSSNERTVAVDSDYIERFKSKAEVIHQGVDEQRGAMLFEPPADGAETPQNGHSKPALKFLVNINTADEQQLQTLPSIGKVLAQRIIEYRNANGDFKKIEDLQHVRGIGKATLKKLEPYIRIN